MSKQNKSAPSKLAFLFLGLASFGLAGDTSTQNAGWLSSSQGSYQGNLQGSNNNLNFGNNQNQIPNIHSAIPQVVQQSTVTQTQTFTNNQPIKPSNTVPTASYSLPLSITYPTVTTSSSYQITLNGSSYVFQNGQSIVVYING